MRPLTSLNPFVDLRRWRRMMVSAMAVALAAAALLGPGAAQAQTASSKIAADLQQVLAASTTGKLNWAKDINGVRHVKALIVSDSTDPDLVALRAQVMAAGGSVYFRFTSVRALSVMVPASAVAALAARSDVRSISPNRMTARTASALEYATGTMASGVRDYVNAINYSGLDGSGVGIAVLDSGVMWNHSNLLNAAGASRVKRAVNFQKAGDGAAAGVKDWTVGVDASAALYPGSASMANYEMLVANDKVNQTDMYGHGTHVASIAAGVGTYQTTDSTGIASNADVYDVRVLNERGYGQLSDVLAGIDWVIYHAREYKIRVMNLSLAADSTETWQTDPLAIAVRSATAAGITVVVAAGNFGQTTSGGERFGTIGSPGHDPSVITVGSANTRATSVRSDDSVNLFSSRGPTRGSFVDTLGVRQVDNLLKPDLVAPGNRIVGALSTDKAIGTMANYLATTYPQLTVVKLSRANAAKTLMQLSGTSISAPAVAGTVALMLQANPQLTPPLVKAILQYTAQPVAGASLLQQGAGLLNVEGAVRLAKVLRTDVSSAVEAGTLVAGANLLAGGKAMPTETSTINGQTFNWSRIVYVGGNQIVSGSALFTKYQPIYDHRLVWAGNVVRRHTVTHWPAAGGVPANTFARAITSAPAGNQSLVTSGVVRANSLVGTSSMIGRTGAFIPAATLSGWLVSGSGVVLGNGVILSEGIVMSESGQIGVSSASDASLLGEP